MQMYKLASIGVVLAAAALTGCTAVRVQPISGDHQVNHICIQNNPKVTVSDFVQVMQEGFNKHGISSEVINSDGKPGCGYTASYTARRTWDITTYLSLAEINVQRDGRQIASAHYHLRGKGGFALNKWASTRTKILPVIDQLLAQVRSGRQAVSAAVAAPAEATGVQVSNADVVPSTDPAVKLARLKDAYDANLITRDEYDAKRKELIDKL
jgi:hypothetical protein